MGVVRITADMKSRMKVGEKGQVVIPKELRELTGIKEGTEVTVGLKDGAVTIRRVGPPRRVTWNTSRTPSQRSFTAK